MTYQVKKAIVSIFSSIPILIFYGMYAYSKHQSGTIDMATDLAFWAKLMLITIGIGIVLTIVIHIAFHIINAIITEREDDPMIEDEMDKLVELKSDRFSFILVGMGFIAALVTLVLKMPPAVMLNVLFFSCYVGSIIGEIAKIFFYQRGI